MPILPEKWKRSGKDLQKWSVSEIFEAINFGVGTTTFVFFIMEEAIQVLQNAVYIAKRKNRLDRVWHYLDYLENTLIPDFEFMVKYAGIFTPAGKAFEKYIEDIKDYIKRYRMIYG